MNDKHKDNVCTKIKYIIALISQGDFSSLCLIVASILLNKFDFSNILRISTPKMRMWDKFYDNHFCKLCAFLYYVNTILKFQEFSLYSNRKLLFCLIAFFSQIGQ